MRRASQNPGLTPLRQLTLKLNSLADTHRAGLLLGQALPRSAIVLLEGGMGAGKTTLAKSVCEGLGIPPEIVISPTYTLVNVYPGRWPVYHVDLFRLETPEALLELDRDDWINPEGPTLIEWPETARPLLSGDKVLEIALELVDISTENRELALREDGGGDAGRGYVYGPVFTALEA